MRKMKVFFAILLIVISGVLIFGSDYIVAFANSMYYSEYKYGNIYESGDEVVLYTSSSYSFVPYVFIGYMDKSGNLLDFHSFTSNIFSGYNGTISYYVGETCVDSVIRVVGEKGIMKKNIFKNFVIIPQLKL